MALYERQTGAFPVCESEVTHIESDYILRKEFEAYNEKCATEHRRLDEENSRQNHRIQVLEENVRQINDLTASVREMNANMLEELKKQGRRLDELEKEPGDSYRQIKMSIATAVISAIVGAMVGAMLILL